MKVAPPARSSGPPLTSLAEVTVRSARPSDVPRIVALSAPFVAQDLLIDRPLEAIRGRIKEFLVATRRTTVVGCVGLTRCDRELLVYNLCVAASAQGAGVGRLLLKNAAAAGMDAGCASLLAATKHTGAWFVVQGFQLVDSLDAPTAWLTHLPQSRGSRLYRRSLPRTGNAH